MRTVKWNPFLSGVCTFLGGMLLWAGAARADISTTNAAAIVVFPKLIVDTSGRMAVDEWVENVPHSIDTIIQLTNTSANPVNVRCFYINANGHCSNDPTAICNPQGPPEDIALDCRSLTPVCIPGWQETDFAFHMTSKQPIAWTVSDGLLNLPLNDIPGGTTGQFNTGSIPPAPENPMVGELKCIEVGTDENPIDHNDLKGEATIEEVDFALDGSGPKSGLRGLSFDTRGYNAIGIQAVAGAQDSVANTLIIGGPTPEYNSCPAQLILDNFFDDAEEPATHENVRTELTLVPCSEDFNFQSVFSTVVQYLVFNEFEQRFSTSRSVTCFSELPLSDIDTRPGNLDGNDRASIFNVNVEGTLTGQTLIRPVADSSTTHGTGLLGVAEEYHQERVLTGHSAAFALQQRGIRTQPDIILLPLAEPAGP